MITQEDAAAFELLPVVWLWGIPVQACIIDFKVPRIDQRNIRAIRMSKVLDERHDAHETFLREIGRP